MRSNRGTSSRIATGTRVGYTGNFNPGVLPSYKMDWQKTTGTNITGISGSKANVRQNGIDKIGKTGYAILESDYADFQKYSAGVSGKNRFSRDYAAASKTYNDWLSGANQRTVDALNKSATNNLGPVKYASVMNDASIETYEAGVDSSRGFSGRNRNVGPVWNSYAPKAGETFKFGQYDQPTSYGFGGRGNSKPTGIYSESRASKTEYSSTIPGTAVGQGGKDPRDRRYLAINKDVKTDNSLQATQAPSTPGELLKRKMQSFGKIGRVSMPSGGGAGEEPRLNISASGVTGLNFN
jgi:hypothetical protein